MLVTMNKTASKKKNIQQVVIIHGGNTHDSVAEFRHELKHEKVEPSDFKRDYVKEWKDKMPEALGKGYEVFYSKMPNNDSAHYPEWKVWFERLLTYVKPGTVFIGHSLGGIFLAKYFSEPNKVKDPKAVILVAPPFGVTDFRLPANTKRLAALGDKLSIFFSEDDEIVSFQNHYKYRTIAPDAQHYVFTDKGHFIQNSFPEMVKLVKKITAA